MRALILVLGLAAISALPSPSLAQVPDSSTSTTSGPVDSAGVPRKKKKGVLGKLLGAAKDKHVQQAAMMAGCSGLVPGASAAVLASGACAAGGVAGMFTGPGGSNGGSADAPATSAGAPAAATDAGPANAGATAQAPVPLPLLSPDDAGYNAPVSTETRTLLEAQIKDAKAAGIPKEMIKSAFATRTDGGGSSMKGLTEGPARTALFSLRNWTDAQAHPGAAQAQAQAAQAQMQSTTSGMPSATAPVAAAPSPSGAPGLQIEGDLATGTVIVRGILWTDPVDDATRQMLASQLQPLATQMNQVGGRLAIVMYGPTPKGGKKALAERSAAFTTALAQLGVVFGQKVTLKPVQYKDAAETRVEISR
jgi:hypothetical protein